MPSTMGVVIAPIYRSGRSQPAATLSVVITSAAARSPERMAPSIQPHMTAELSLSAQWMDLNDCRQLIGTVNRGGQ
jgi:hypothetical protein